MPPVIRTLTARDLVALGSIHADGVVDAGDIACRGPKRRPSITSFRFRRLLGLGALASSGDCLFEGCAPQTYILTEDREHMSDFRKIGAALLANGDSVEVLAGRYRQGGQTAIVLRDAATGEPYATLSTNLAVHGAAVAPDAFTVKVWSENAGLAPQLLASGLFVDTGQRVPTGFVEAPVWALKDPAHIPPLPRMRRQPRDRER